MNYDYLCSHSDKQQARCSWTDKKTGDEPFRPPKQWHWSSVWYTESRDIRDIFPGNQKRIHLFSLFCV